MIKILNFLVQFIGYNRINAPAIYLISILIALAEIIIFMISAASLEFFFSNNDQGLQKLISFGYSFGYESLTLQQLLIFGIILTGINIYLNFRLLYQIKIKIVHLGRIIEKKLIKLYLKKHLDFQHERNSKMDLKVFTESILVITENIILQLYLAMSRLVTVIIYSTVGIVLVGPSLILTIAFILSLFMVSLFIFSQRTRVLSHNINYFGERRLRTLTNFVEGRSDINLFGFPNSLSNKLDDKIKQLPNNKILMMTEVHKPRVIIEGVVISILIGLGLLKLLNQEIQLTTNHITGLLLVLRLIPSVHQFTSNLRSAASASWAISDVNKLLAKRNTFQLQNAKEPLWSCRVKFQPNERNWLSIQAQSHTATPNEEIIFHPGIVNIVKGPSGVGKSSLIQAIVETLQKHDDWIPKLQKMTSLMPQNPVTFLIPFKENIVMGADISTEKITNDEEHLGFTGTWVSLFDENVADDKLIVSGGQAQRLAFLRCTGNKHRSILLFDEPTSALDRDLCRVVAQRIEQLAREGKFIIVITHSDINISEKFKRVIEL